MTVWATVKFTPATSVQKKGSFGAAFSRMFLSLSFPLLFIGVQRCVGEGKLETREQVNSLNTYGKKTVNPREGNSFNTSYFVVSQLLWWCWEKENSKPESG